MNARKVQMFMQLAGQKSVEKLHGGDPAQRKLGAQLLLSEVLEYVIHGLGVIPTFNGQQISEPNQLKYDAVKDPDFKEMVDGLADVAYTMYWNGCAFGVPLEQAFDMVCDNNLEKFVHLEGWSKGEITLEQSCWDCGKGVSWPAEVERVNVIKVDGEFYAVGKDGSGKVRKPSTYKSVDLSALL